jgi:hypothetical protein
MTSETLAYIQGSSCHTQFRLVDTSIMWSSLSSAPARYCKLVGVWLSSRRDHNHHIGCGSTRELFSLLQPRQCLWAHCHQQPRQRGDTGLSVPPVADHQGHLVQLVIEVTHACVCSQRALTRHQQLVLSSVSQTAIKLPLDRLQSCLLMELQSSLGYLISSVAISYTGPTLSARQTTLLVPVRLA